ncbi:MAG: amino acid adenylation domain-containing protein, partial [Cyanobacteria bacterium]|nr:amino acid adenylation domain-containing protein [Cyanobacteria bacterium GSL.Bin21]
MNTFRAPNSMNFQPDPLWSEWNQTQTEYPYDKYIHQLFEEKVTQFPEKVAVIFEDQQLTYQELNSKANQLANYLQTQGVEPESLVGIYLQRSLEMVVALLGVLKAGGTYVPLDPTFPPERLSYMMADAAPCVTLTQQSLLSDLQQIPQAEATILICLDQWEKISAPESGQNLNCVISASNLAYTIYTSGSTGKPKGVEITHGSVVNFLYSMARAPGINAQDILLAVTTISFDIAGLELYLPLSVGAQVVLASTEATSSPVLLEQLMQTHRVTIMQATPATWYLLLAAKWSGHPGLKILSGGELLPHALAHQLLERGACVWNLYGPTEATIWASVYQVKSLDESEFRENENAPEPIGYPIANTQLYVLDSSLRPVSMGVTGDLYISGVGLARGYRNQPELTQQKFIPNPFGQGRLYYTGDLARYLPDGNLQFLGRSDHQIKIRGFRIELGEIESVLNEHQGVHQSIVDIYEESSAQVPGGSKRLVAYIVPNSDYQVKATDNNFELQDEQVNQWGQLWDLAYTEQTFSSDPTFNISGWNDSYSGKPIPTPDMQEWLDGTVERILSCRPNRVLEIGCGTGMLLFRIAPQCTDYYGTDIALNALRYIHAQLERLEGDWSHVTLSQRPAHNFEGFEPETFDTVIINSVIQLFPSIDYLVDVVEKAVRVIRPGGTIFLGDVRNLALLEAFHASIQLYQAPESLPKSQLRQRIQKSLIQEGQLAINPEFFTTLQQYLPRISEVELQLRRGHFYNELTKFRYDVILYLDRDQSSATQPQWLNWQEDHLSLSKVRSSLIEEKPLLLGIKQVPNARLLSESKLMDLIKQ